MGYCHKSSDKKIERKMFCFKSIVVWGAKKMIKRMENNFTEWDKCAPLYMIKVNI